MYYLDLHTRDLSAVVTAIAYHEARWQRGALLLRQKRGKGSWCSSKEASLGSKLKDGDRVVMIEDVTTSGKSMEETVPKVRGAADVTIDDGEP